MISAAVRLGETPNDRSRLGEGFRRSLNYGGVQRGICAALGAICTDGDQQESVPLGKNIGWVYAWRYSLARDFAAIVDVIGCHQLQWRTGGNHVVQVDE